ncbi:CYFA0S14e00936g1_1 [Cyberlindnera fabianii]|uniref:Eukaryotic translation initiation factor 3 subunit C n=1 Tax=Cyberlindnera fabianii TaxID=36022 RepID=A0A061B325_CYBFA|nr:Eukaryotic translation initiation factor 3 subunit C [Cyberlindnera fabianii]CDR44217.1 CYFA0S14e00936g1_1 [Cyberlindnera fabianii]
MSSRFFQGGTSDSEYSSSEEELLSSSDEEELVSSSEEEQSDNDQDDDNDSDDSFFGNDDDDEDSDDDVAGGARGPAYFLKRSAGGAAGSDDESSDDEEGKKVVKSAKDKLLDEIKATVSTIDTSKASNDWVVVLSEFDKLGRLLTRAQQQSVGTPNVYIRSLAALDDTITKTAEDEKSNKKQLNAIVAKAFNTVRQRAKKAVREQKTLIDAYRADPDAFANDETPAVGSSRATPVPQATTSTKTSTSAGLFLALRSVTESRGKKNVDTKEQIKTLEELTTVATTPYESIVVYLMLIPLRFDGASSMNYMPLEQWNAVAADINALFKVLEDNKDTYRVLENAEPLDDIETEPKPKANGIREILGSVVSFVERLDDEFTRSLQVIDPHTTEYIDRLKDEQIIYSTIVRAQLYSELVTPKSALTTASAEQLARIISRRLDHIYFKPASLIKAAESSAWESIDQTSYIIQYSTSDAYIHELMDTLASVLYKQPTSTHRKRAILYHIYFYAFNNKYFKARDMFLMSHLQSSIHTSDPSLQILFNRSLVQLGLCAFRNGLIPEAHQALNEIATSPRHRELLGQSSQRFSSQASVADKQRQLPYHMHINLELLESVFLTSSLLIEIPQYAQLGSSLDGKKRLQTKSFRRTLDFHERQTFQGPPENTRDHIMHAAKALQAGEWKKSAEMLTTLKIWNLVPESDKLREMIKEKVQVEGLRTFLFQFKSYYSKLSITKLTQTFELPEAKVSAVVSKMIFKEEIAAGLDQVSNSIIFAKGVELTKLQELALTLADKAQTFSERNERLAGAHQPQGYAAGHHSSGRDGQRQNRQQRNTNLKFAPVTGALDSAPGSISGALNGMDKRRQRTNRA